MGRIVDEAKRGAPTAPVTPAKLSIGQEAREEQDFRKFLQSELLRRCRNNPRYSLRAFARVLRLESSFLSRLLQGKRSITEAMVDRLSQPLALSPEQVVRFKEHLRSQKAARKRRLPAPPPQPFDELTVDTFHLIADWYHYAILELTTVEHFEPDVKWMAKTLGIPVPLASNAVERLVRLGLLCVTRDGKLLQSRGNHTTVGSPFTAAAFRKLQREILERALTALEDVPIERRDQSSVTVAIASSRLVEAKHRIQEFRRELAQFLNEPGPRDAVYQLSISLYPITEEGLESGTEGVKA